MGWPPGFLRLWACDLWACLLRDPLWASGRCSGWSGRSESGLPSGSPLTADLSMIFCRFPACCSSVLQRAPANQSPVRVPPVLCCSPQASTQAPG